MKLLSATLLGVLTSGIIASEVYDGAFYLDLDGRRRPRPPKGCKGPKCSNGGRPTVAPKKTLRPTRPSKKAPPKKAPKGSRTEKLVSFDYFEIFGHVRSKYQLYLG